MEDYCEGCIHYVLQAVACSTDRGEQLLWEPTCIADKCKSEVKENGKSRNF
ncbi:TPA: hypothetical protein N2D60_003511 [Clostridium botulinum]|nr:hypothetical protein [Clostridium botulinum]